MAAYPQSDKPPQVPWPDPERSALPNPPPAALTASMADLGPVPPGANETVTLQEAPALSAEAQSFVSWYSLLVAPVTDTVRFWRVEFPIFDIVAVCVALVVPEACGANAKV